MKYFIAVMTTLVFLSAADAQIPQFAVVRPDGTTYICPSFDSAYVRAADDDIIYMPGTVISGNKTIGKRLILIGTGHYPDSTVYTGKTLFTGTINLDKKCTLEGFEVTNSIFITNSNAAGCSFIRIKCNGLYLTGTNDHYIDGCVINIVISGGNLAGSCMSSSNVLVKNSLIQLVTKIEYSNITGCVFLGSNGATFYNKTANTIFLNCIFRGSYGFNWNGEPQCFSIAGNVSNYSVWYVAPGLSGVGNLATTQPDTVMVNSGLTGEAFNYSYNYHLRPNSMYLTAGEGGTQIGIYGGPSPYKEGAVPSNPHIYFKQVAPQTNSSGQLQVQFRVRSDN